MSIPSQPADPHRPNTAQGAGAPRPPANHADPAHLPGPPEYPEPDEAEDAPADAEEVPAPRPPRLGQSPRGKRLARPPDNAPPA
jgi:hypothetical protein